MRFWFYFFYLKKKNYYKLKLFFKKYLIFFKFFNKFIYIKFKKKILNDRLFKDFFWKLESRIDIFLFRNGFIKNLIQANYFLNNNGIFVNGICVKNSVVKVNSNDIIQISFQFIVFLESFFKEKLNKLNFFFFFKSVTYKKKYPFYIEKNQRINSCILLYKPEPSHNIFSNIINFNFFFYKYLFYFLKKKTF